MALWPLILYFSLVLIVVTAMVGLSYLLGERHEEPATGQPYESGMPTTGSARLRLSVKFYLTAMFFVVFDLEAAFIYAWAVSAREVGWAGYIEIVIFVGILIIALIYLIRVGALQWGTERQRRLESKQQREEP